MKTNRNTTSRRKTTGIKITGPQPTPIAVVHPSKRKATTKCKGKSKKPKQETSTPEWLFTVGYTINLEWCTQSKFTEFISLIEAQNWINLFQNCTSHVIYPELLFKLKKTFTFNNEVCQAVIQNRNIHFDASYLSNIFQVPNFGYDEYIKRKQSVKIGKFTEIDIVKFIGGNPSKKTTLHHHFSPLYKLLFNFTWRGVLQRLQKRSVASLLNSAILFCLANKIQINFPKLMIEHLLYFSNKCIIPYASLLTVVFKSFGVDVMREDPVILQPENLLSENSLAALSLHIVDGHISFLPKWSEKQKETKGKEVDEGTSGDKIEKGRVDKNDDFEGAAVSEEEEERSEVHYEKESETEDEDEDEEELNATEKESEKEKQKYPLVETESESEGEEEKSESEGNHFLRGKLSERQQVRRNRKLL